MLEQHGVVHFEEPCPYWQIEQTAEVRAALDLDVAGGEQDCFLWQWERIVGMPSVDIVQPDVAYVGGFTRALEVAELAAEAGLPCTPHSANISLVTQFAQHLMCAIPNAGAYVECRSRAPTTTRGSTTSTTRRSWSRTASCRPQRRPAGGSRSPRVAAGRRAPLDPSLTQPCTASSAGTSTRSIGADGASHRPAAEPGHDDRGEARSARSAAGGSSPPSRAVAGAVDPPAGDAKDARALDVPGHLLVDRAV